MYLLTQTKKQNDKTYKYYSIVQSYRKEKKTCIRIIHRLGSLSDREAEQMRMVLKLSQPDKRAVLSVEDIIFFDHWQYLDVAILNCHWEEWQLCEVFDSSGRTSVGTLEIAKILTFNRCVDPGSKSYASRWVKRTALDHILKIDPQKVNDDKIYRELPKIESKKGHLEQHLFRRIQQSTPESLSIVFYDLSISYFEGTNCPLARSGLTRDAGVKSQTIVLSLIIDQNGLPFSWDILEGNTADVVTIEAKVRDCKKRFGIERVTLVFDRGMVSEENLALIEEGGYHYISALDKDQIPSIKGLQLELFKGDHPDQIIKQLRGAGFKEYDAELYYQEIDDEARRYIVGFNPTLFVEERYLRQQRFDRLIQFVQQKNQTLCRAKKSVNEAAVRRSLDERLKGLRKFFSFQVSPLVLKTPSGTEVKSFQVVLEPKPENIGRAELLDGVCAFITNHKDKEANLYKYPASRVIQSYRQKDKIEQFFRNIKSFIQFNPVYVFKEEHVRAHYTICVLAYLMNISITNRIKAAGVVGDDNTALRSPGSIYEELSKCILGEFKAFIDGDPVRKLQNTTSTQMQILAALNCQYLVTPQYLKKILTT